MQRQAEYERQIFNDSLEGTDNQIKLFFQGDQLVEVELPTDCDQDFLDLFNRVTDVVHTTYTQNIQMEPVAV